MAVGSNTLGLLFKIGVDSKDAATAFKQIEANANELAKGIDEGIAAGLKEANLNFQKLGTTGQQSFNQLARSANQLREGLQNFSSGDVAQGFTSFARALGPVGIGLAVVAAAAAGAVLAIKHMVSTAEEVGTQSKEDFDKLNESVKAAGGTLTELDRALSQDILKSIETLHGATTDLWTEVIRVAGPALRNFFKELAGLIEDLKPLIHSIAQEIENDLILLTAFIDTIRLIKKALDTEGATALLLLDANSIFTIFNAAIDAAQKAAQTHGKATDAADKHTKALKDLTQAQLEQNRAQRELDEAQADAAAQQAEIDRQLKLGVITAAEAAGKRLAIEQNLRNLEDALLDAQKKRIEAEVKGEKARTDALEENASKRVILEKNAAAEQAAINAQQNTDQIKQNEDRLKRLDQVLKKETEIADAVIRERARAAQQIPGGGIGGADRGIAPIPGVKSVTDALKDLPKPAGGFLDDLGKALTQSGDMFTTWGDLAKDVLTGVAGAAKQTLEAFILTGKGGALAFKQLVASILSSLVIEAAVKAIFELAEGFAAMFLDPPAAHAHFQAAALYGIVAATAGVAAVAIGASGGLAGGGAASAAGAGGFGGTSAAPGEVTINQGAAATTLGITAQALFDIRDHLSNITTAPPGDVLQRGVDQNPLAVGHGVNEAGRRDGTVTRNFLEIAGLRPA